MAKNTTFSNYTEEIINLYLNCNIGAKAIGKIYGCGEKPIFRILKENNIPMKICSDNRKYNLDEHYMDNIDCQEKAYILGFFYADGTNGTKGENIKFRNNIEDKDIIERIQQCFNSNYPLKYNKKRINKQNIFSNESVEINLNSYYLSSVFTKLGAPSNKTWRIEWPTWLREDLYQHFIRGYFDGDGSFTILSKKSNTVRYKIGGNSKFIIGLKDYLESLNFHPVLETRHLKSGNIFQEVSINRQQEVKNFGDYIYRDSTIHLQRKYDRYYSHFYEGKPIIPYSQQQSQDKILNNIDNKNPNPETGEINLKDD